jgi:peptidoglycan/xylan/chitin deacetylase (PgdA/CDA1 family)
MPAPPGVRLPGRWWLGAAGLAAAAAAHPGPALTSITAVRRYTPALAGSGAAGHVALTFDDGPVPASTPAVLGALDRLGWQATFFMLGEEARRSPGLAAEVAAAGHEVAVHGDDHRNLLYRDPAATLAGLRRARDTVAEATGAAPRWFRPPYGVLPGPAWLGARRLGLRPVLWTAWGRDWEAAATPATILAHLERGQLAGGTVLLHDFAASGSWRATVAALPLLAELLDGYGLAVGSLARHGLDRPA